MARVRAIPLCAPGWKPCLPHLSSPEPCFREALQIQRLLLGNEHPAAAYTLRNLGFLVYEPNDRREEGVDLLRGAWAINRKALGSARDTIAR